MISVTAFGGLTARQYGVINRSPFPTLNVTEIRLLTEVCPPFHDVRAALEVSASSHLVTNTIFDHKHFI